MSVPSRDRLGKGPFLSNQLKPGDRYELSSGHPIYRPARSGEITRLIGAASLLLDSDPEVQSCGIDAGFSPTPKTLRAPDIAVGGVPDKPGWIPGAPPLAVEYASVGQDEAELQAKIADLLAAGTRFVWVVRLIGPRRVEVYEPGRSPRTLGSGEVLRAPGILRNDVPVEALYDRNVAHELTLRNLLQRRGYGTLDEVRQEGREEGREEGRADALIAVLQSRGLEVPAEAQARIRACRDAKVLDLWLGRAVSVRSASELFER